MSDYLMRLVAKNLNLYKTILPRQVSLYDPLSKDLRETIDAECLGLNSFNESHAVDSSILNMQSIKPFRNDENSAPTKLEENLPDEPRQPSSRPLSIRQSLASDNIREKGDNRTSIERSDDLSCFEGRRDTNASKASRDNSSEELLLVSEKETFHNLEMSPPKTRLQKIENADYLGETTEPNIADLASEPSIAVQSHLRKGDFEKTQVDINNQEPSKEIEIPMYEQQRMKPSTSDPSSRNPHYELPLYGGRIAEKRLFETKEESNSLIPKSSPIPISSKDDESINGNMYISGSRQIPTRPSLASLPLLDTSMSDKITVDREDNEIHAFLHTLQPERMNYHKEGMDVNALKTFEDDSSKEVPSTLNQGIPVNPKIVQSKSTLDKTEYALAKRQMDEPHIAQPSLEDMGLIKKSMLPKEEKTLKTKEIYSREKTHPHIKGTEKKSNYKQTQEPAIIEEDWQNMRYPLRPQPVYPKYVDISPSKRNIIREGTNTNLPISSSDIEGSIEQKLNFSNHRPEITPGSRGVKSSEQSVIKEDEKVYPQSIQAHRSDENLQQQASATSPFIAPPSEDAQFIKIDISEKLRTARHGNISESQSLGDSIIEYRRVSDMPEDMPKVQPITHRISEAKKDDIAALSSEDKKNSEAKYADLSLLKSMISKVQETGISTVKDEREKYAEGIPIQTDTSTGEQLTPVSSSQTSLSQDEAIKERNLIRTIDVIKGTKSPLPFHSDKIESKNAQEISSKSSPPTILDSHFALQPSIKRVPLKLSPTKISFLKDAVQSEQSDIKSSTNKNPSSVRVTIGRVDVHAPPVERIISRESSSTSAKKLSLDDYLKMRNEGRL